MFCCRSGYDFLLLASEAGLISLTAHTCVSVSGLSFVVTLNLSLTSSTVQLPKWSYQYLDSTVSQFGEFNFVTELKTPLRLFRVWTRAHALSVTVCLSVNTSWCVSGLGPVGSVGADDTRLVWLYAAAVRCSTGFSGFSRSCWFLIGYNSDRNSLDESSEQMLTAIGQHLFLCKLLAYKTELRSFSREIKRAMLAVSSLSCLRRSRTVLSVGQLHCGNSQRLHLKYEPSRPESLVVVNNTFSCINVNFSMKNVLKWKVQLPSTVPSFVDFMVQ